MYKRYINSIIIIIIISRFMSSKRQKYFFWLFYLLEGYPRYGNYFYHEASEWFFCLQH